MKSNGSLDDMTNIVLCMSEGLGTLVVCLSVIVSVTTGRKVFIFSKVSCTLIYLITYVRMTMRERAYGKR